MVRRDIEETRERKKERKERKGKKTLISTVLNCNEIY